MKVLLVLNSTDQHDAVLQALDVCTNSMRFGIRTCVAALGGGDLERQFEESGASFYRLDRESNPDLNAAFKLRKIIASEEIEIVHSYGIVEAAHVYMAVLGLRSVKTALTYHNVPTGREVPALPVGAKFAARRMDAGIVPSHALFPRLRKSGLDTSNGFYYVPYGLDPKRVSDGKIALKEVLGIGDKDKLIGMSADFGSKGATDQLTVCKALPEVLAKYPKARFIFSGNVRAGGERNFEACLEFCDGAGIGDKVFFSVDSPELRILAGSVDIFVYSASDGPMPLDVIDAMLAGTPLVVSDVEPLLELTNGGKCVQVFVRGDEKELAQSIVTLIKNRRLREKRASDAKQYSGSNHSIEIHLGMLKNLYSELVRADKDVKKKKSKAASENAKNERDEKGSLLGLE